MSGENINSMNMGNGNKSDNNANEVVDERMETARKEVKGEVGYEEWREKMHDIGVKVLNAIELGERDKGEVRGALGEIADMATKMVELAKEVNQMDASEEAQNKRAEYAGILVEVRQKMDEAERLIMEKEKILDDKRSGREVNRIVEEVHSWDDVSVDSSANADGGYQKRKVMTGGGLHLAENMDNKGAAVVPETKDAMDDTMKKWADKEMPTGKDAEDDTMKKWADKEMPTGKDAEDELMKKVAELKSSGEMSAKDIAAELDEVAKNDDRGRDVIREAQETLEKEIKAFDEKGDREFEEFLKKANGESVVPKTKDAMDDTMKRMVDKEMPTGKDAEDDTMKKWADREMPTGKDAMTPTMKKVIETGMPKKKNVGENDERKLRDNEVVGTDGSVVNVDDFAEGIRKKIEGDSEDDSSEKDDDDDELNGHIRFDKVNKEDWERKMKGEDDDWDNKTWTEKARDYLEHHRGLVKRIGAGALAIVVAMGGMIGIKVSGYGEERGKNTEGKDPKLQTSMVDFGGFDNGVRYGDIEAGGVEFGGEKGQTESQNIVVIPEQKPAEGDVEKLTLDDRFSAWAEKMTGKTYKEVHVGREEVGHPDFLNGGGVEIQTKEQRDAFFQGQNVKAIATYDAINDMTVPKEGIPFNPYNISKFELKMPTAEHTAGNIESTIETSNDMAALYGAVLGLDGYGGMKYEDVKVMAGEMEQNESFWAKGARKVVMDGFAELAEGAEQVDLSAGTFYSQEYSNLPSGEWGIVATSRQLGGLGNETFLVYQNVDDETFENACRINGMNAQYVRDNGGVLATKTGCGQIGILFRNVVAAPVAVQQETPGTQVVTPEVPPEVTPEVTPEVKTPEQIAQSMEDFNRSENAEGGVPQAGLEGEVTEEPVVQYETQREVAQEMPQVDLSENGEATAAQEEANREAEELGTEDRSFDYMTDIADMYNNLAGRQ